MSPDVHVVEKLAMMAEGIAVVESVDRLQALKCWTCCQEREEDPHEEN